MKGDESRKNAFLRVAASARTPAHRATKVWLTIVAIIIGGPHYTPGLKRIANKFGEGERNRGFTGLRLADSQTRPKGCQAS